MAHKSVGHAHCPDCGECLLFPVLTHRCYARSMDIEILQIIVEETARAPHTPIALSYADSLHGEDSEPANSPDDF